MKTIERLSMLMVAWGLLGVWYSLSMRAFEEQIKRPYFNRGVRAFAEDLAGFAERQSANELADDQK